MKRSPRGTLVAACLAVSLLVLTAVFPVRIPLGVFDQYLEQRIGSLINRTVSLQDPPSLRLSLQPTLELGRFSVGNPEDWPEPEPFLTVAGAVGQLSLLPLLRGDVHVVDFEMTGVEMRLVTRRDHSINYRLTPPDRKKTATNGSSFKLAAVDGVRMRDITVTYHDELSATSYVLTIAAATASGKINEPLLLRAEGAINDQPLVLELTGDSLSALTNPGNSWSLSAGRLSIGEAAIDLAGTLGREQGALAGFLDASLAGPGLTALGNIFGLSLPESGEFTLGGRFSLLPGTVQATNLIFASKRAEISADLIVALHGARPTVMGNVTVETIDQQFFRNFLARRSEPDNAPTTEEEPGDITIPWNLMQSVDTDLHVRMTGRRIGAVALSRFHGIVSLVGGDLFLQISAQAAGAPLKVSLGVRSDLEVPAVVLDGYIEQVRLEPFLGPSESESRLEGGVDRLSFSAQATGKTPTELLKALELDLQARANDPLRLKEHLNGRFRFGVIPEEMKSGVIDLWAVNILMAALPKLMEGSSSEINCLAGDFSIDDGIMKPEVFLLDTTRMRVQGTGVVNFKDDTIDLSLRPTPNSQQFFSLATPVAITGTLTDFHVGVGAGGVIQTVFRLLGSVVTVPLQKLFSEDMEADGIKACAAAMEWVAEEELRKTNRARETAPLPETVPENND